MTLDRPMVAAMLGHLALMMKKYKHARVHVPTSQKPGWDGSFHRFDIKAVKSAQRSLKRSK